MITFRKSLCHTCMMNYKNDGVYPPLIIFFLRQCCSDCTKHFLYILLKDPHPRMNCYPFGCKCLLVSSSLSHHPQSIENSIGVMTYILQKHIKAEHLSKLNECSACAYIFFPIHLLPGLWISVIFCETFNQHLQIP